MRLRHTQASVSSSRPPAGTALALSAAHFLVLSQHFEVVMGRLVSGQGAPSARTSERKSAPLEGYGDLMHLAGIHTHMEKGRAFVRVVVLREDQDAWVYHDRFPVRSDPQQDLPHQLMDLSYDLPHRLQPLSLVAAVLRDRDHSQQRAKTNDLKIDFTADGVVLAELCRHCPQIRVESGSRIGSMVGTDKAPAEQAAADEFGRSYKEAGAAARAAATLV